MGDTPELVQSKAGADPKNEKPRLIIVLERACLETAKVGKDYVLLDCDNHKNFLLKHKRNPADYRPDILHQVRAAARPRRSARGLARAPHDLQLCAHSRHSGCQVQAGRQEEHGAREQRRARAKLCIALEHWGAVTQKKVLGRLRLHALARRQAPAPRHQRQSWRLSMEAWDRSLRGARKNHELRYRPAIRRRPSTP
jgi:hypothetical protein